MSRHFHAIVWIDHQEAKIFEFDAAAVDPRVVRTHNTGRHLQHKANVPGSGHHGVDREFFERVLDALEGVGAILITGPGGAKLELQNYMNEHRPQVAQRVAAIETLDHPTDAQLVALGRKFFKADDRMRPQAAGAA
jgi:stalled ribosome rescue protein Dom34